MTFAHRFPTLHPAGWCGLAAALLCAAPIQAQSAAPPRFPLQAGDQVRVLSSVTGPLPLRGSVAALQGDTLWIAFRAGGAPVAIPAGVLKNLELRTGLRAQPAYALFGAGLGAATLGGAGYLIGGLHDFCFLCEPEPGRTRWTPRATIGGAAIGALVGGWLGARRAPERWRVLPIPPPTPPSPRSST